MFKKILKGIVVGGAALTIAASAAQAGTINMNLYGASAQYKFWNASAPAFLKYLGCADADLYSADDAGKKKGIHVCAGDTAYPEVKSNQTGSGITGNANTIVFRYTSKNSGNGILSVQGYDDPAAATPECSTQGYRDQATITGTSFAHYPSVGTSVATACQEVNIGASDVSAATFAQESHGQKLGPLGGGYKDAYFFGGTAALPDPEENGYTAYRPVVVPFGFYAKDDVPYTNLSRLMAVSLFTGQVTNWNEFGTSTSLPVVLCLRHAGSGTHATLDAAVIRGVTAIMYNEQLPGSTNVTDGTYPVTYFNEESGDMINCVKGQSGAVGYADADTCTGTCLTSNGIIAPTFQGVVANRNTIKNGQYDFWSAQWLYARTSDTTLSGLTAKLETFGSDPDNLPPSKATYWASQNEMKWWKSTDFAYPQQR